MRGLARALGVVSCFLLLAGGGAADAARPDEESGPPLRHWSAPAYWSPVRPTPVESAATSSAGRTALLATPPAYAFVAIAPCRQYDSRNTSSLLNATPRNVTLTGAPCNIPAGVAAVSANIALFNIVGAGSNGVFTVGLPAGTSQAWINYASTVGQIDNAGALAVDGSGAVAVQLNQGGGSVDFVVDVNGYYTLNGIVAQSATTAGSATNFTGSLSGDVTGTQGATVVSTVGGSTAANLHGAELAANTATSANTAGTIVKRDGSGGIAVGAVASAGPVSASGFTQPGTGGETLRTIRGIFTGATGAIVSGSGFTVTRQSTGIYRIDYSTSFSGFPSILATVEYGNGQFQMGCMVGGMQVWQSFLVCQQNNTGGTVDPLRVHFSIIGPP